MNIEGQDYKKFFLNLNKKLVQQFFVHIKTEKNRQLNHLYHDILKTTNLEKKEMHFLIEFCKTQNIISINKELYRYNKGLNKESFFIEFCRHYFNRIYSNEKIFENIFKKSKLTLKNDNLIIDSKSIDINYTPLLTTLSRLGFLNYEGNQATINNILLAKKLLQRPLKKLKKSQKDFEKEQYEKTERGNLAEEYVLAIEKEKLIKTKHKPIRISIDDVGAGYDILSFEKNGSELYIEVKALLKNRFFWSENEINTAKELGGKYRIHLVFFKKGRPCKIFKVIKNPYQEIFINNNYHKKNIEDYIVFV